MTLIELMIALAVIATLAAIAVPYLGDMMRNWRMTSQTNELLSDLATARGQAAGVGQTMTVCASSNGTACATDWAAGRIVFMDTDASGTVNGAEQVFRRGAAIASGLTIAVSNVTTAGRVQFRPTGVASGVSGGGATFKLCDDRAGQYGRLVTVTPTGRASFATVTCP